MRVGKIHGYSGANDLSSTLSVVPVPDNSNYTTVFKYVPTGYYYERLSTGVIRKVTCCKGNENNFVVNLSQAGVAVPTGVLITGDIVPSGVSYVGVGVYQIAFAGSPFTNPVAISIANPSPAVGFARAIVKNAQTLEIQTFDNTFAPADSILTGETLRVSVDI